MIKQIRIMGGGGGRGIIYCDEWEKFENFYDWAINNGYNDELTIDRIDNDGNYYPENCRWSTHRTQNNNRSIWGKIKYHGIVPDNTGYRAQVSINGKKKYIAHSISDIEYLVNARNYYIMKHNLPNKLNKYINPSMVKLYGVASRGRDPNNPSNRNSGIETVQRLELNTSGCSNCITSVLKDCWVLEITHD